MLNVFLFPCPLGNKKEYQRYQSESNMLTFTRFPLQQLIYKTRHYKTNWWSRGQKINNGILQKEFLPKNILCRQNNYRVKIRS